MNERVHVKKYERKVRLLGYTSIEDFRRAVEQIVLPDISTLVAGELRVIFSMERFTMEVGSLFQNEPVEIHVSTFEGSKKYKYNISGFKEAKRDIVNFYRTYIEREIEEEKESYRPPIPYKLYRRIRGLHHPKYGYFYGQFGDSKEKNKLHKLWKSGDLKGLEDYVNVLRKKYRGD